MNPILKEFLVTVFRWALAIVAGWLVKAGVLNVGDVEKYIAAGALALVVLVWSLWSRYKSRVKLLTALTLPAGTTENNVNEHIASGAPTPTVTTPSNTIPGVPKP